MTGPVSLLVQILIVPLLFVPIAYFASKHFGWKTGWIAFIPLAYTTLISLYLVSYVSKNGAVLGVWPLAPSVGLNFGFMADGLSTPIIFTIALLCTVVAIYSMPYMEHKLGEHGSGHGAYYALYLLYAIGMLGTAMSTNLIQFYFFWELMLVPSWALINIWGYGEREKIALKYFIYTHIGALSLLAGILSVYAIFGTFDIPSLLSLVHGGLHPLGLLRWVVLAMFLGFAVKMAVVPLHTWLPDAHAEAPTPISALLSPAMIGLGGYALVRLTFTLFPEAFEQFSIIFSLLALVTMIYGGIMALAQDDIKRLLAYSSVSQMGYLLFGIASSYPQGLSGSMFHYVSHGTCKAILFMMAGAIMLETHGIRSIRRLGGLAGKMPLTAIFTLIGFLGIAGTPPLNGFQSEWLIFTGAFAGAIEAHNVTRLLITVVALIGTVLTAGYALWTIRRIFFGPLPEHLDEVHEAPALTTVPMLILALATIILGIYPTPLLRLLSIFFG